MGADPIELEREIEHQRERIAEKIGHLEGRIQSDLEEARSAAKQQVTSGFGLDEKVRRRLPIVLTGAFGGGLALGVAAGVRRKRA